MDEITFGDMLVHYQAKLQEASDEIQNIKIKLREASATAESGWSGDACDACRAKLETAEAEISQVSGEISEATSKLSAIVTLIAENEIPMI